MNTHRHKFKFECNSAQNHKHTLAGYTEYMIGVNSFHIHFYFGISSYLNHTHYFSGFSGLPVKTENGHIHKLDGILEVTNMHEHKYSSFTHEDVSYLQDGNTRMALV